MMAEYIQRKLRALLLRYFSDDLVLAYDRGFAAGVADANVEAYDEGYAHGLEDGGAPITNVRHTR